MLFDLQSGRRRTVVRIVYGFLAGLFLIGFVLFGIGGDVSLDPTELFGGSDEPTASQFQSQIDEAEKKLAEDPKSEDALTDLARYRYLSGQATLEADEATGLGAVTEETRTEWAKALDAWERLLKTEPRNLEPQLTAQMVCAYDPSNPTCLTTGGDPSSIDYQGAAETQAILAEEDPSLQTYGILAFYQYSAGDISAGDSAADKALAEAPKADRDKVEKELDTLGESARKALKESGKGGDQDAAAAPGGTSLSNPFGGLGSGAAPPGGAPPAP